MDGKHVIGVDVGGTKILAGVVDDGGTVERQGETPTPTGSQAELLEALEAAVARLIDDGVAAIGFGVPSTIDARTGLVAGSVNIPLAGIDLARHMAARFGRPVAVENDASVAALGEFRVGAGRASRTIVMLTLGTGCGGGVVSDGALLRGWAELGHIVIELDGLPCQGTCTGRGHLEAYVSGTAASRRAGERLGAGVDAHELIRLAGVGDERAREVLEEIGRRLGAGIGSLVNVFDPDLVVIGGGFGTAAFEWLAPAALASARREVLPPGQERLQVVPAELGAAAGLIGAGLLAAGLR